VIYWGYLLSTFLIAAAIYFLRDRERGQSIFALLKYCFPASVYRTRSFVHDVAILVINLILFGLVLSFVSFTAERLGSGIYHWMLSQFGAVASPANGTVASVLYMLAVMLAVDLGFFISHYLHHKIPLLWEFHKVHHTAPVLNPLTALRRHPLDLFIELNITALLLGFVIACASYLSNDKLDMLSILGVNAGVFIFLMIGSHLQHSHIWLSYGPLNKLFVSPAMHHIHHSFAEEHLDKNMGSMFSFWDWIMGTRYIPQKREKLTLGLASEEDTKNLATLGDLYIQPFIRLFHRLFLRNGRH